MNTPSRSEHLLGRDALWIGTPSGSKASSESGNLLDRERLLESMSYLTFRYLNGRGRVRYDMLCKGAAPACPSAGIRQAATGRLAATPRVPGCARLPRTRRERASRAATDE